MGSRSPAGKAPKKVTCKRGREVVLEVSFCRSHDALRVSVLGALVALLWSSSRKLLKIDDVCDGEDKCECGYHVGIKMFGFRFDDEFGVHCLEGSHRRHAKALEKIG